MEQFAYAIGVALVHSFVGFYLGLSYVSYAYKLKLIALAKLIAYLVSVLMTAIVISVANTTSSEVQVVIGSCLGFVVTALIGRLLKNNHNNVSGED